MFRSKLGIPKGCYGGWLRNPFRTTEESMVSPYLAFGGEPSFSFFLIGGFCPSGVIPSHSLPILGVVSPLFSTIVHFENQRFPRVSGGFLERRIPGKNGEGTPRRAMASKWMARL